MDYMKLSKEISYALRHAPWEYELELDEYGWVKIDLLIKSLQLSYEWQNLIKHDIEEMILKSEKKRHEIKDDKIRALYGHSLSKKIVKEVKSPPDILFHGTTIENYESIKSTGLLPLSRQYVHLSIDIETAQKVAIRHSKNYIILSIDTMEAINEGVDFYYGNEKVWLVDKLPPEFISVYNKT